MGANKLRYLYLATAAIILLGAAQIPQAEARSFIGVNPFCRTANYRLICTKMVNGASSLRDATANAMISAHVLATRVRGLVPLLKPAVAHLQPISQESIIATCTEDFDAIVDDLEVSLQALQAGDIGTARSHLSGALRSDCKDAMKQFGVDFPLNKYATHLKIQVDNCLAVMMQN
ncbi:hypothetical protein CASFOL_020916 [Castilleja foliolosa]|uniref:Pectinesterase inhibitor domain-containing protein n=1 Tax=Castilleja foliolosa TaxID=1961234 RepID=A0ABD3D588_9LAMI